MQAIYLLDKSNSLKVKYLNDLLLGDLCNPYSVQILFMTISDLFLFQNILLFIETGQLLITYNNINNYLFAIYVILNIIIPNLIVIHYMILIIYSILFLK